MKNELIPVLMQPEARNSYWMDHIRNGIKDGAREWNDTVCSVELNNSSVNFSGKHVLVAGSNIGWLESSVYRLMNQNAYPVIVNACMLPVRQFRCSGVIFELEEMLDHCLELLRVAGRKHTVLLGVNPNSVSDRIKADAFEKAVCCSGTDNIIWAMEHLDRCVLEFVQKLESSSCDSVICANDTAAVCLIHFLTEMGYKLPEDIYVIGMGNSFVGAGLRTRLTSVMFDYYEMGVMAVRLYHNLCRSSVQFHSTVSLPCRLVVRDSAPLAENVGIGYIPAAEMQLNGTYFESDIIQNIIRIEAILQAGDAADREILFGIARGESCETIAEKLFFTDRAVRYRLNKLVIKYGFENRAELEADLKRAIGEN